MIKEFTLQGLGCANCAAKIERAAQNLNGVALASVNFLTTTLRLEVDENFAENLRQKIEEIVHRYEPDVLVLEKTDAGKAAQESQGDTAQIVRLATGAVVLAAGMVWENFAGTNSLAVFAVFVLDYLLLGGDILWRAGKNISRGKVFDENFLMSIATIGAFLIGENSEAVGVMLFYQTGEFFQERAVAKTKKSIASLMGIRPDFANLMQGGQMVKTAPENVKIGDVIVVKPGEKIPLDGVVLEGEAMLDTAALTGESVPRRASAADSVLSGCINQNGLLKIKVTQTFGQSTVAKIIELVENAAAKKAPTENFITKFARYYTPAVVALAVLIAAIPPLFFGGVFSDWLRSGLIFLVISCPCALVISIPLGFFGGIGRASRNGILIKGGNYLEALNQLDTVVFDKTGTLTEGVFKVRSVLNEQGFSAAYVLAAAAKAEAFSQHPIALSILREYGQTVAQNTLSAYEEIAGQGVCVLADGRKIAVGNKQLMAKQGIVLPQTKAAGTSVYVAVDATLAGCIIISDEIKKDSLAAIAALKANGIGKTVLLSGDEPQIAQSVAAALNLDEAYGGLLPHQKVEQVERLQKGQRKKLAFVGDGINDAPVLAMADIGVAMGALGSDAAIEAADVVIMTDEPSKVAQAIEIARATNRVVWQNIVLALGIKALILLLGAMGLATLWEAVFADVGVALLAILNSLRLLKHG